jgi:RNA polymerase sigma-70 factor (ECF subfamily)
MYWESPMDAIDTTVIDLITSHKATLERYVRTLVRDPDEAADVCQEVAVRLLLAARAGSLPETPGAWMNRVAHNLVVSSARRRQTAARSADRLVERGSQPSTEETIIGRERDLVVMAALGAARDDDREAMLLAASGFRTAEIAARLGRTELATRALLCRARGRMRQRLELVGVA